MHISMFHGTHSDYIQIVCHQEQYQEKLKTLGFVNSLDELPLDWPHIAPAQDESDSNEPEIDNEEDSETEPSLAEGVSAMQSKDEVEALIKEKFGIDIDKRGSLETVKEKALAIINKPAE